MGNFIKLWLPTGLCSLHVWWPLIAAICISMTKRALNRGVEKWKNATKKVLHGSESVHRAQSFNCLLIKNLNLIRATEFILLALGLMRAQHHLLSLLEIYSWHKRRSKRFNDGIILILPANSNKKICWEIPLRPPLWRPHKEILIEAISLILISSAIKLSTFSLNFQKSWKEMLLTDVSANGTGLSKAWHYMTVVKE